VQRKQRDRYNEDFDFYGAYVKYKGFTDAGVEAYFFAVDDTGNRMNPNGNAGDRSIYTLGTRLWCKRGNFDYEAEVAGQWGRWAGDTVQAWSASVVGGYTFKDLACKPRIGAGFDWASGDRNPTNGTVNTFDQLFPLGHAYLGYLDLIGRQNVTSLNLNLSAWVVPKKIKSRIAYHAFWLSSRKDAMYNAGGGIVRRDMFGDSGREIGHELDITVAWNIKPHQKMLFGYSHFWDSDLIEQTGVSEDADLFYVQYLFTF
jgi:hypothetical protein